MGLWSWLTGRGKDEATDTPSAPRGDDEEPFFVCVQVQAEFDAMQRYEQIEQPLERALGELGEITGGGTMLSPAGDDGTRTITQCDIDVDLFDRDAGLEVLRREMRRLGLAEQTVLDYELDGEDVEESLGSE